MNMGSRRQLEAVFLNLDSDDNPLSFLNLSITRQRSHIPFQRRSGGSQNSFLPPFRIQQEQHPTQDHLYAHI